MSELYFDFERLRTRGLFQYGDLQALFAQFFGWFGERGNHSHPHRLQVRVWSLMGFKLVPNPAVDWLFANGYRAVALAGELFSGFAIREAYRIPGSGQDHRVNRFVTDNLKAICVKPNVHSVPFHEYEYIPVGIVCQR